MKRFTAVLAAVLVSFALSMPAVAQDDIARIKACKFCGMNREMYAHSRVWVEYSDGSVEGLCSLRCSAVELSLTLDKFPKLIAVGDYNSKKLIDAEAAFWVMGGSKPGVMTGRAKWAFEKQEDADAFIQANGGEKLSFEQAVKAAYDDMYTDTRMIRDRREAKRKAATEKKP